MSRRGRTPKRVVQKDSEYQSILLQRFINRIMTDGKKSTAERIVYGALDLVKQRAKKDPLPVFELAVKNVTPLMEVKSRRVGGSTYQVPIEVAEGRARSLALKWLRDYSRERPGKSMTEKLAAELLEASTGGGFAIKKKEDVHRMAEANKAFAHFRW